MAIHGIEFMQEMVQISQQFEKNPITRVDRMVQFVSDPIFGREYFAASPAQFGLDLLESSVAGEVAIVDPYNGCEKIKNPAKIAGRIAVVRRGDCMFQEKVKRLQEIGAIGVIIIDNNQGTSIKNSPSFVMSGEQTSVDDLKIPAVFLFAIEGQKLLNRILGDYRLIIRLSDDLLNPSFLFEEYALGRCCRRLPRQNFNDFVGFNPKTNILHLNFHLQFEDVTGLSESEFHVLLRQQIEQITRFVYFGSKKESDAFKQIVANILRQIRKETDIKMDFVKLRELANKIKIHPTYGVEKPNYILEIKCNIKERRCWFEDEKRIRVNEHENAKTEL